MTRDFAQKFERQTMLPVTVVNTTNVILSANTRAQLDRDRKQFKQRVIIFNHGGVTIPNKFVTSTKGSFECVAAHHNALSKASKLTAGIKMPDEYYFDICQKNVFIIEKKTQQVLGSVDEKIQAAGFKQ